MSMMVLKDTAFKIKWIFRKGSDVTDITENSFNISIIDAHSVTTHYRDAEYDFTYVAPTSTTDGYLETANIIPTLEGIITVKLNIDNSSNNKQSTRLASVSAYVAVPTTLIEKSISLVQ